MLTQFKALSLGKLLQQFTPAPKTLAAIYFERSCIQIVRTSATADGLELDRAQVIELPKDLQHNAWQDNADGLVNFLRSAFDWNSLQGAHLVAILDGSATCLKELNMPILNEQELTQAVKWDAIQYLPYPEGSYCYGYLVAPWENADGEGLKVSLIATKQSIVNVISSVCSQLNLILECLTVSSLALRELVHTSYEYYIVLDIGWERTLLTIFHKQRPIYETSIEIGQEYLANAMANQLQLSLTQAKVLLNSRTDLSKLMLSNNSIYEQLDILINDWATQISMSVENYQLNHQFQMLEAIFIAAAPHALSQELRTCVSTQLNIYCEHLLVLDSFDIADNLHIAANSTELTVALGGLSLPEHGCDLNILPKEHRSKYLPNRKRYKLIISACITVFICALGYELLLLHSYQKTYEQLNIQHDEIALWRKRSELVNRLETDCFQREILIVQLQSKRNAWPQVLSALGYSTPDGLSITGIARIKDSDSYILRGRAEHIEYVNEFINTLHKTKAFRSIRLQQLGESGVTTINSEFLINLKGMGTSNATTTGLVE